MAKGRKGIFQMHRRYHRNLRQSEDKILCQRERMKVSIQDLCSFAFCFPLESQVLLFPLIQEPNIKQYFWLSYHRILFFVHFFLSSGTSNASLFSSNKGNNNNHHRNLSPNTILMNTFHLVFLLFIHCLLFVYMLCTPFRR